MKIGFIGAGRIASTLAATMALSETVHVMELMDSLHREWGLGYPMEP